MNSFVHFKELIPKALAHYKMTRQARAALICARFRDFCDEMISPDADAMIRPKYFKGHTLTIAVPSSLWAQRVYVHRHELLMKLNLDLEKDWVHDIRTVVEG